MKGAALALILGAAPLAAQEPCRLALQLGLDVSASVDALEYDQQLTGLAQSLLAPEVVEGFLGGPGPVALSIFLWSGRFHQEVILDWVVITSEAQLAAIAVDLARQPRRPEDLPTAIGHALSFAADRFASAPPCQFQTLDISGDGQNNDGFPPAFAYAQSVFDSITVNALAIGGASVGIDRYFREHLLHGPGAFLEYAISHEDFAAAMRRKLERELRVMILGDLPLPTGQLPL